MDPHSRLSQFNQRSPSSGPSLLQSRFPDSAPKHGGKTQKTRLKTATATAAFSSPYMRQMATNSRVKQDVKYRNDIYLSFVSNALQQKAQGVSDTFDELVSQFNPKSIADKGDPQYTQIRLWISALSHVVSRLERIHSSLVEAIIAFPWTTMDATTVNSYIHFVGLLLSARPEYLGLVLGKITQGFTYQSGLQSLNASLPEGSSTPLTRRTIYDRLHALLRHIYSLIPTLPYTLQPLLIQNFPHKRQNQAAQTTYVRNLLTITQICPELADVVLATIIERAIQIDVEIQVELEDLEDDSQHNEEIFEIDPFDAVVGQIESSSDSDQSDDEGSDFSDLSDVEDNDTMEVPTNLQHIREMVKKLDAILKLVFDHLDYNQSPLAHPTPTPCSPIPNHDSSPFPMDGHQPTSSVPPFESRRAAQFNTLLSIFERTILCTFKSRYTQFLVFWYTSLDPEFCDVFQGMLVSKALLEQAQPFVTRAAAASYIASFVSRAQFVDREGVRRIVGVLCDFLQNHLAVFDAESNSAAAPLNPAQHHIFYAVAQAVFLIFCFRWRDLQENDHEDADEILDDLRTAKKWISELDIIQRLITCPLNPLKVCSENVVMQFARVAQATDFIYCYSILELNKRLECGVGRTGARVQHSSTLGIAQSSLNTELNTFFPFDPYKLPKSNSYIQGIYRDWSSVAVDGDDDSDEDDFSEDDEGGACSGGRYLDIPGTNAHSDSRTLAESLDAMSISPLRPLAMT